MQAGICENCGQPIDPGDMFCLNCGYMVGHPTMQTYADEYADVPAVQQQSQQEQQSSGAASTDYSQGVSGQSSAVGAMGNASSTQDTARLIVAEQPGYCIKCGTPYSVGWAFCIQCGKRLFGVEDSNVYTRVADNTTIREPDLSIFTNEKSYNTTTRTPDLSIFHSDVGASQFTGLESVNIEYFADDDADDSPTMMYEDEEDMDAPTMVFDEPSPVYKIVRHRTNESYEFSLPAILGKGSVATVRVSGNRGISRAHAKIYESDGRVWLEDNGSTNKTMVNGTKLLPGEPVQLSNGDVLALADETFDFIVE